MRRLGIVLILVLLVAACDTVPFLPRSDALLASVQLTGGECPTGTCSSRFDVYRDGRVERPDGPPQQLDAATLGRLHAQVEGADWEAILARPFTGECPTAYDGQEITYTFHAVGGPVTIASCSVQIDPGQEPFSTLMGALFGVGG